MPGPGIVCFKHVLSPSCVLGLERGTMKKYRSSRYGCAAMYSKALLWFPKVPPRLRLPARLLLCGDRSSSRLVRAKGPKVNRV